METSSKHIIPAIATHPGSILKRELEERGLQQKDFASLIDVELSNLSALLNGKCNVTIDIAQKLESVLSIPSKHWMKLQANYESDLAKIKARSAEEKQGSQKRLSLKERINLNILHRNVPAFK